MGKVLYNDGSCTSNCNRNAAGGGGSGIKASNVCLDMNGDNKTDLFVEEPLIDIGLDCAVIPLRHRGLVMVQTTDFFYPLVHDPYLQGRIACCNVLSDLYAMGVPFCDNMLMLLGIPSIMTTEEREIVVPMMMRGFKDQAELAGTRVTGGQTVLNPWCIIGGVATAVTDYDSLVMPHYAKPGDLLVLTKPLGTQVAVNAKQWLVENSADWLARIASAEDNASDKDNINRLYRDAKLSMAELNQMAAKLMLDFNARCCTDVTGFGLFGHADNLCKAQNDKQLQFVFHTLPILKGAKQIDKALDYMFKLEQGLSAETSGGLLISFAPTSVEGFVTQFEKLTGRECWVVGSVRRTVEESSSPSQCKYKKTSSSNKTTTPLPPAVVFDNISVVEVQFDSIFTNETSSSNYVCGNIQPQHFHDLTHPNYSGETF